MDGVVFFRESPCTEILPTWFLCYKILYSLTFVQLKYPQVWKSSNQFYDVWRVRHFVTYFLQHVLCVGKCLMYVKFYSKEYLFSFSNKWPFLVNKTTKLLILKSKDYFICFLEAAMKRADTVGVCSNNFEMYVSFIIGWLIKEYKILHIWYDLLISWIYRT